MTMFIYIINKDGFIFVKRINGPSGSMTMFSWDKNIKSISVVCDCMINFQVWKLHRAFHLYMLLMLHLAQSFGSVIYRVE